MNMQPDFAAEKKLLLAEWRKQGKQGEPTDEQVIVFAERRAYAAYRAMVAQQRVEKAA